MAKECNCASCQESDRYFEIIGKLPEEDKEFMEQVYMKLIEAETENARHDAIMNGVWPESVQRLKDALKLAVAKEHIRNHQGFAEISREDK